ncbi:TPM domain-containing protein [Mucilaginibacter terrae]|uniref:Membrane protein n=1 Tax=Mucilaginibacter terrae TaxID=1955052 RepID=A0ABU3GWN0_9SPHI|nr:TPM domain-containing protein [Mucilaginibacter terrae]MDT3404159.1 putative membrane protein [Mucilaginibacter terrae]
MKFNEEAQQRIRHAIEQAEKNTSGEIRICVEKSCKDEDPLNRAASYFYKLGMEKTSLRNGVLIYLATDDQKFAIIGDQGINNLVPPNFWDKTKESMLSYFKDGDVLQGLIIGIEYAGKQLQRYFPVNAGDKNELSDDIVFIDGE